MMNTPTTIREMNAELQARCGAAGIPFDCGAGGLLTSHIAVIAEAPGERELQQHAPLVGGSGKLTWDVLRKDGLTRNSVYITNVVKRKLVTVANGVAPKNAKLLVSKSEFSHWSGLLHQELSMLPNLQFVLALGNYALQALCGLTGITHYRGSVLSADIGGRSVQVVCAFNPAAAIHEPKNEIVFRMDCHKLTRVLKGEHSAPAINALINPSFSDAKDFLRCIHSLDTPIAHDIETLGNETACVGFAASDNEGMCINFRSHDENHYTLEQERDLRLLIAALLGDRSKKFIAQNGNFDAYWMWYKDRIRVHSYWFDTMLAHHFLYPSLPHDLGFLTAQYTDYPYYKDEGQVWKDTALVTPESINNFWTYNVKDCCITRMVSHKLHQELVEQGMDAAFFSHVMRLQPHLVGMTANGVLCDQQLKSQFISELTAGVDEARELCITTARAATGSSDLQFNPRSWPDLRRVCFEQLKLVGRGDSVDAVNRERMRKHPRTSDDARQFLLAVDRYLGEAKFLGTYADSRVDPDGRFRCEYKQTGVASAPGRLSSAGTMWGNGLNMQNIPERAKGMFIADRGYMMTYFDKSQIEARLVAMFADIPVWKEQFERARLEPGSYDAHCALAADMFKVPYDDVPRSDFTPTGERSIRYIAKRCRHGLNYRMGPDRLATVTGLSLVEAELAYRAYHRTTPEIMRWWDALIDRVRRERKLVSPFGRRWLLLERFDESALDSIVAFLPQSTAGDLVASYIYECHEHPSWPRDEARVILNNHDALIVLHTHTCGAEVLGVLKEVNARPITIGNEQLVIPAEYAQSQPDDHGVHRWSTLAKLKEAA